MSCIISDLSGIASTLNKVTIPSGHKLKAYGSVIHEATSAFQLPTGTTAQRPGSPVTGYMRYNTTVSAIEVYDGSAWASIVSAVKGSSSDIPATDPSEILLDDPNAPDGAYYYSHTGGSGTYQTFTDMHHGGWLLVGKIPSSPADTSNPWSYNGARWNATSVTNESQTTNTNDGDALNRGYYEYTATEGFRMGMTYWNNQIYVPRGGVTAREAFTNNYNSNMPNRNQMLDWILQYRTEWDNQPHCNRVGFNRTDSSNTGMRFGITMNNENECNSNDSAVGFGCYTNNQSGSGSRNCAAGGFRWNSTVRYATSGYIFVK